METHEARLARIKYDYEMGGRQDFYRDQMTAEYFHKHGLPSKYDLEMSGYPDADYRMRQNRALYELFYGEEQ